MPSRKKSHGRPAATPATPDQSYAQAAAPPPPAPPAPAVPGPASFASEEFEEAFEDVHTRFILNLPDSELGSADRIFFQLEQAYWFYDDIICDGGEDPDQPEMPRLPRFKHLKNFAHKMFSFSPLLEPMLPQFATMYAQFIKYKCGKGECGTCEVMVDGQWVRSCVTRIPLVPEGESYTINVRESMVKPTKKSTRFFSKRGGRTRT